MRNIKCLYIDQIWDFLLYGRIHIKKQLKIYFQNAYYESTDNGDIVTVESYDAINYKDIGSVNGHRNSDIIDIRPRVSNYTVSAGVRSPLEFYGRSFDGAGQSAGNVLASDESIIVSYLNKLIPGIRSYGVENHHIQLKKLKIWIAK